MAMEFRFMRFSERGVPLLSPAEKCHALCSEMHIGSEDAEGHIWDILSFILSDDVPDDWVQQMRRKFGKPTPLAVLES